MNNDDFYKDKDESGLWDTDVGCIGGANDRLGVKSELGWDIWYGGTKEAGGEGYWGNEEIEVGFWVKYGFGRFVTPDGIALLFKKLILLLPKLTPLMLAGCCCGWYESIPNLCCYPPNPIKACWPIPNCPWVPWLMLLNLLLFLLLEGYIERELFLSELGVRLSLALLISLPLSFSGLLL